jgi:hypothetical protein
MQSRELGRDRRWCGATEQVFNFTQASPRESSVFDRQATGGRYTLPSKLQRDHDRN